MRRGRSPRGARTSSPATQMPSTRHAPRERPSASVGATAAASGERLDARHQLRVARAASGADEISSVAGAEPVDGSDDRARGEVGEGGLHVGGIDSRAKVLLQPLHVERARARCSSAVGDRSRGRPAGARAIRGWFVRAPPTFHLRHSELRDGDAPTSPAARCRGRNRSRSPVLAGASHVTLLMPPMFTTAREMDAWRNTASWKAGTRGAPWPPAAMSRRRKSATTSIPVSSARQRRIVELDGEAHFGTMPHGLAVASDRDDGFAFDAGFRKRGLDRARVECARAARPRGRRDRAGPCPARKARGGRRAAVRRTRRSRRRACAALRRRSRPGPHRRRRGSCPT